MRTNTLTRNKEKPSRPTSSKASIKSTPYHSSEISNRSPKNTAEEPSAPIATNWDTGRKIVVFTNVPIATYTNPTMRNTYASSNHLDLTVDQGPPSNRSHLHHHLSPFESHTKEDSKPRNPPPPSHHPPRLPLPAEKSPKIREKGRKRTITPANKEKPKEKSIELLTTSRENGIEEWRNFPNSKTNPTNTTTKPSEISTKNHMDFRILMGISNRRRRVMLRFHFPMPTITRQTLLFLTRTLDVTMTSL